jgi:hypothetical protein
MFQWQAKRPARPAMLHGDGVIRHHHALHASLSPLLLDLARRGPQRVPPTGAQGRAPFQEPPLCGPGPALLFNLLAARLLPLQGGQWARQSDVCGLGTALNRRLPAPLRLLVPSPCRGGPPPLDVRPHALRDGGGPPAAARARQEPTLPGPPGPQPPSWRTTSRWGVG